MPRQKVSGPAQRWTVGSLDRLEVLEHEKMGYTTAVAACAAALLAPAAFARRGSSGPLCRTDQNAGELRAYKL